MSLHNGKRECESVRIKQKRRGLWIQSNILKWNPDTFPEPSLLRPFYTPSQPWPSKSYRQLGFNTHSLLSVDSVWEKYDCIWCHRPYHLFHCLVATICCVYRDHQFALQHVHACFSLWTLNSILPNIICSWFILIISVILTDVISYVILFCFVRCDRFKFLLSVNNNSVIWINGHCIFGYCFQIKVRVASLAIIKLRISLGLDILGNIWDNVNTQQNI